MVSGIDGVGCFAEVIISWDVIPELKMMSSERRYMLSIEHMKTRMWMSA